MQARYDKALAYAKQAHGTQLRKYTLAPYWTHCVAVAQLVANHVPGHTIEMLETALLHDVLEDTTVTEEELRETFGPLVTIGVHFLTDWGSMKVPNIARASRVIRKYNYAVQLGLAPPWVQTVKLADLIDNTSSIVKHDPKFATVYLPEKRMLLKQLMLADRNLYVLAESTLHSAESTLNLRQPT